MIENDKNYITATFSIAYTVYTAICEALMEKRKYSEEDCLKEIHNTIIDNVIEYKLYGKFARLTTLEKNFKNAADYVEYMILRIELFLYGKEIVGYDRLMKSMNEELRITRESEKNGE